MEAIIYSGWLEKKRKATKHHIPGLVSKYNKRWFELTADTLAYAGDPRELRESHIEVYAIHEMQYVKRLDDVRIEVKFPERLLVVKAASPGEADKWNVALEKAMKEKQQGPGTPHQRAVENIKKSQIITALTIEAESDDEDERQAHTPAAKTPGTTRAPPPLLLRTLSPPKPERDSLQVSDRPPSPRSLLANPRMGNMMISTPTKPSPSDDEDTADHDPVRSWDEGSGSDSEHPASSAGARTPVRTPQRDAGSQRIVLGGARDSSECEHDSDREGGSRSPKPSAEEPVRRYLPSTLRSSIALQDEPAPALRGSRPDSPAGVGPFPCSPGGSLGLGVGRPGSLTPGSPGGVTAHASPRSSAASMSIRRADVLTLEPQPQQRSLGGPQASGSRPGSNASSRLSSERPGSRPLTAQDERLELSPPPPAVAGPRQTMCRTGSTSAPRPPAAPSTGAARGHSAGSSAGQTSATASARAQSANSSIGINQSAAETEDGDNNWDSWDEDSGDDDDDSAMHRHPQRKGVGKDVAPVKPQHGHVSDEDAADTPVRAAPARVAVHASKQQQQQQQQATTWEQRQVSGGKAAQQQHVGRGHHQRLEDSDELQGHPAEPALRPDTNFVEENWDSD